MTSGLSSIKPNDAGDELDASQEVPRGLLVSGGDGTELLDLGEEVLDQMARGIKLLVIVARRGPVGSRRDHRGLAGGGQWRKDADSASNALSAISVSASIEGSRWSAPSRSCASPPVRKIGSGCPRVRPRHESGAQSAARAPDCLVLTSFFWAPALCWWARTMVLSIIAYSLSASAARCWNIRSQTPLLAQRLNRIWDLCPLTEPLRQIAPWHPGTKGSCPREWCKSGG